MSFLKLCLKTELGIEIMAGALYYISVEEMHTAENLLEQLYTEA